jgi:ketosteroid isomerase-like protein
VSERDDFLHAVLPRLTEADTAIHNGDATHRIALWSRNDPVTLLGAKLGGSGWNEIRPIFEQLASRFSDCESFEYEVIAADATGDLGYLVGFEHTTASIGGGPPQPYSLRVTTIFRRESGEWKIVHRHADPVQGGPAALDQLR